MLSKAAPPLRTAVVSFRLQPAFAKTQHTSSITQRRAQDSKSITSSTTTFASPIRILTIQQQTRRESTVTTSSESHIPTATTTPSSQPKPEPPSQNESRKTDDALITWNDFFALRKRRRWWQMGTSVVSAMTTTVGGIATVLRIDPNSFASVIPQIDPMFTMGMATMGFGFAGWMVGPFLGTAVWRMRNRGVVGEMEVKEKEFFSRIKKYRVDPAGSSMQNPVPDYYGEKIGSVQGYRRWLKDQRVFNKKRLASIV